MTESGLCSAMPETDIIGLKETLQSQQNLLQKLYNELDEEREASATSASEALSMILRLQGEKAVVQMEANQYKRLAEEKMSHAENSLYVFEDLIYQKEMEISSLEFQVQAYRCRLLSMGCNDLGDYECKFPENLVLQRSDSCKVETGANSNLRRLQSLPPIQLKEYYQKKSNLEKERSVIPMSDWSPRIGKQNTDQNVKVQNLDLEKNSGSPIVGTSDSYWEQIKKLDDRVKDISGDKVSGRENSFNLKGKYSPRSLLPQVSIEKQNTDQNVKVQNLDLEKNSGSPIVGTSDSYWEQIKKLDDRVKDISGDKVSGRENSFNLKEKYSPRSLLPQVSIEKFHGTNKGESLTNFEKIKLHENIQEREAIGNSSCTSSVQDIFEVPQCTENHNAYKIQKKEQSKLVLEGENRPGKPDLVPEDSSRLHITDATDKIKKMLPFANHDNKISKARDGLSDDCNAALVQPTIGAVESQAMLQLLCHRIERLEGDRNYIRQEITEEGEGQLKLLKEIQDQLNVIQTELRSLRTKKSPPQDDQPLHFLSEVWLSFSVFPFFFFFCSYNNCQVPAEFLFSSCLCSS